MLFLEPTQHIALHFKAATLPTGLRRGLSRPIRVGRNIVFCALRFP